MALSRSKLFGSWAVFVAAACFLAQLALASSAFWHHHEDDLARHDDCAVCVAVVTDRTDGLPPPVVALAPPQLLGVIEIPARDCQPSRSLCIPLARGPPKA